MCSASRCRAAHLGSATSCPCPGSSARRAPHSEHRPGQSSRQRGCNGSASTTASRSTGSRSSRSPSSRGSSSSASAGSPGRRRAPGRRPRGRWLTRSRQRTHSPASGAGHRAGDEDAFDDRLEPEVQLERRSLRDPEDVDAEIGRCRNRSGERPHRPRPPAELAGVEHERQPWVEGCAVLLVSSGMVISGSGASSGAPGGTGTGYRDRFPVRPKSAQVSAGRGPPPTGARTRRRPVPRCPCPPRPVTFSRPRRTAPSVFSRTTSKLASLVST